MLLYLTVFVSFTVPHGNDRSRAVISWQPTLWGRTVMEQQGLTWREIAASSNYQNVDQMYEWSSLAIVMVTLVVTWNLTFCMLTAMLCGFVRERSES